MSFLYFQAMCGLLQCGPSFDPNGLVTGGYLYKWLQTVLNSPKEKVGLFHWTISNILITACSVSSDIKMLEKWVEKLGVAVFFFKTDFEVSGYQLKHWVACSRLRDSPIPEIEKARTREWNGRKLGRGLRPSLFLFTATARFSWITRSHCFTYASSLLSESLTQAKHWIECWYSLTHKHLFLRNSKLNVAKFLDD